MQIRNRGWGSCGGTAYYNTHGSIGCLVWDDITRITSACGLKRLTYLGQESGNKVMFTMVRSMRSGFE